MLAQISRRLCLSMECSSSMVIFCRQSIFFGNVECFVGFVGEEGVFFYFLSECSAAYKVGMKKNTMRVGLDIWQHFQVGDLSGSKTDDGSVLVVVILSSVFNITTFYIFQV